MDKIFERFYTDRPQQNFGQNSGLGLSISKQIVEAHSGTLWVENRIGQAIACWARGSRCAAGGVMTDADAPAGVSPSIHASTVLSDARAVLIRGRPELESRGLHTS